MPELPEVETMRRNIESALLQHQIASYGLTLPKLLRQSPIPTLDPIDNSTIVAVRRRAKVLMIDLDNDLTIAIHCKLAGQVAIYGGDGRRWVAGHPVPKPDDDYPHKSTHLTITFTDGSIFYYSDIRQFGWVRLGDREMIAAMVLEMKFGPEGVDDDGLNEEVLFNGLQRRRIPIKTALLDQSLLAGLGNIYVDEALHRAKIHPSLPANQLERERIPGLLTAIDWALREGIRQGGAKIIHNRAHPVDQFPEVHGRGGEPCFVCGDIISKVRVGARGTYLCPTCQPLPSGVKAPTPAAKSKVEDDE
ncbi:DNA-formamidopyrimidine glycosylase [soil metagenome]